MVPRMDNEERIASATCGPGKTGLHIAGFFRGQASSQLFLLLMTRQRGGQHVTDIRDMWGSAPLGPAQAPYQRKASNCAISFIGFFSNQRLRVVFPWVLALLVNVDLPAHCSKQVWEVLKILRSRRHKR